MKILNTIIICSLVLFYLISCKGKKNTKVQIIESNNNHVADSIFINGVADKIVFKDTTYGIDSIVFKYFDQDGKKLKSVETFHDGRKIFENLYYHPNGNLKRYKFICDDNERLFYSRWYTAKGEFSSSEGQIFFQSYITNIDIETGEIKKGKPIEYKIYYPAPPDCKTRFLVKNDDGSFSEDVFRKSKVLNYLQLMGHDNDDLGTYKVNICLEMYPNNRDTLSSYSAALIFKVVP